jgi:hypothetical protein
MRSDWKPRDIIYTTKVTLGIIGIILVAYLIIKNFVN